MIPLKIQERVSKANAELSNWTNGQAIDISANVGTSGILRAAQGDMCYLFFPLLTGKPKAFQWIISQGQSFQKYIGYV